MHVDGAPPVASLPRDVAIEAFYGRCTPEQADWAADRVRPQALAPFVTPVELGREERVAATRPPRAYVISAHDRALPTALQRRLGARQPGHGHRRARRRPLPVPVADERAGRGPGDARRAGARHLTRRLNEP